MREETKIEIIGCGDELRTRYESILSYKTLKPITATTEAIVKLFKDLRYRIYTANWAREKEMSYDFIYDHYNELEELYNLEINYTLQLFYRLWIKINHYTGKGLKRDQFDMLLTLAQLKELKELGVPLETVTHPGFIKYFDQIQRRKVFEYLVRSYKSKPEILVLVLKGSIPEDYPHEFLSFATLRLRLRKDFRETNYLKEMVEQELEVKVSG